MNGPLPSVYVIGNSDSNGRREKQSKPEPPSAVVAPPPKPQPRSTVPGPPVTTASRPVTVGALREAKAATATTTQRVPITQRTKEPEVPARLKQKRKTIAFGVTTNVSQTVERENIPPAPLPSDPPVPTRPPPLRIMSLARTGVGAERGVPSGANSARPLTGHAPRQTLAPLPPIGNENRSPANGEEIMQEMKEQIGHLETRIVLLEKQERESRKRETELQKQVDRLATYVGTLAAHITALEEEKGEKSEEKEEEDDRPRRLQYSSDEGREGRGERGRKTTTTRRELFNDEDTVRALERQLSLNPLLRQQLDDALEQDKYERQYGDKRPNTRQRRSSYFDEHDEPRAPAGRCAPSAPQPNQRWQEETRVKRERSRGPPSGGRRGRADTTPSRRARVTERVTMERVHHFDDDSEEEMGGGGNFDERYDSDDRPTYGGGTQYNEEVVEDFQSVAQPDGRRGYGSQPARMNQRQQQYRGGQRAVAPVITEVTDSDEDSLDRKRRKLKERKEARERGGR